jgi:hypothetical protein
MIKPEQVSSEEYSTRPGMSWTIDGMHILIYDCGTLVMKISLGEALEGSHRSLVENHIREINRSPWISNWHNLEE